jgi:putative tRNA adenosine deaminase-associated protein
MENEIQDLALLAWRDDGSWLVSELSLDATSDIGIALDSLRAKQVNGGALAFLAVDDAFFIIIRQIGLKMQMVLSDVISALEYEIAAEVLELLDLELPAEDDAAEPAGDLNLLEDLGIDAMELQAICDDAQMYPDEQLEAIARRIGFGDEFLDALDHQ